MSQRFGAEPDDSESFEARVATYMRPLAGWFGYGSAVVAVVASLTTIALGARDFWDLKGPGWAKVLAWFAVGLVVMSLVAVYVEQFRHRRDVARLIKQERLARLELFKAYQSETERQEGEFRQRERDLEAKLSEFARNARVAVALPAIHGAFHHLRDSKYLRDKGSDRAEWEHELVRSLRWMSQSLFGKNPLFRGLIVASRVR